jgi:hypothetical protein
MRAKTEFSRASWSRFAERRMNPRASALKEIGTYPSSYLYSQVRQLTKYVSTKIVIYAMSKKSTTSKRDRVSRDTTASERPIVTTTFRIFSDQRDALQRAALRDRAGGSGRADASAVLREVLDAAGMKE